MLTLLIVPGSVVVGDFFSWPDMLPENQPNILLSSAPLDLCKWPVVGEID